MQSILQARQVSFGYGTTGALFDRWEMEFTRGEIVALTGPSGRGKSTLLYILGLMLKPSAGTLLVDGVDATHLSDSKRANLRATQFGFVFQDAALDPTRCVLDNITEGALYRNDSLQLARSIGLELMQRFGVNVPPNRKPGQISGGQAQRIALCRALLGGPPILIADEPTGNLDAASAEQVMAAFEAHARQGGLVLVATHDRDLAAACTRRIEL